MWYVLGVMMTMCPSDPLKKVLTTYAVLESSFRKQQSGFKRKGVIIKEASIMHSIKWNRVIILHPIVYKYSPSC